MGGGVRVVLRRAAAGELEVKRAEPGQGLVDQRVVPAVFEGADLPEDRRGMAAQFPRQRADRKPLFDMAKIEAQVFRQPGGQDRRRVVHYRHFSPIFGDASRRLNQNVLNRWLIWLPVG